MQVNCRRTVLHVDVDAFYVTAERSRNPDLAGRPVAVSQYNSGGFVAVSHEAREAGIRKGDGVGDAGRAAIRWLRENKSISLEEARRKCPSLVVLPMNTDYYREFSGRIHALLSRCLGAGASVERASCDDFYCEIRGGGQLACEAGLRRPPECHVYPSSSSSSSSSSASAPFLAAAADPDCGGGTSVKEEEEEKEKGEEEDEEEDSNRMTAGEEAAVRIRSTLRSELGITASVGIATNKTLAKLIGACFLLLSVCPLLLSVCPLN
jgi:nucleotidyltransferase/DNA polymerase involved in DNA repair